MKIVKWETIKNKIATETYTNMTKNCFHEAAYFALIESIHNKKSWRENSKIFADKTWDIIMTWDIRCCDRLLKLFPHALPKKYQNKPITCDMDEKENWILIIN